MPQKLLLVASGVLHVLLGRAMQVETLPEQIHIALAGAAEDGRSNGMAISWVTMQPTSNSIVRYGTSPVNLSQVVLGRSRSYLESWNHDVVLPNLLPATEYFYQCGSSNGGFSKIFSFQSAPDAESRTEIIVLGDMGVQNSAGTRAVLNKTHGSAAFIWNVGDISYADFAWHADPTQFVFEKTWNEFMNWMQPVASTTPYMTIPGNHEADCGSPACKANPKLMHALGNFTAYNYRFRMPSAESGGVMNMWYSFNYGPIHFVSIDTETDFPGAPDDNYTTPNGGFGDQMKWLTADLAHAASPQQRAVRPWILVAGHRPMYTIGNFDNTTDRPATSCADLQAAMEGLFMKHGVDVYFAGHKHSYERSWPVFNTTNIQKSYDHPTAPVYVVIGSAGNLEGHYIYDSGQAAWNAKYDDRNYGISRVVVEGNALVFQYLGGDDGSVLDTFTLTKDH